MKKRARPADTLYDFIREQVQEWSVVHERLAKALGARDAETDEQMRALANGEPVQVPGWKIASAFYDLGVKSPVNPSDFGRYEVSPDGSFRRATN